MWPNYAPPVCPPVPADVDNTSTLHIHIHLHISTLPQYVLCGLYYVVIIGEL
jgi:hypothetical protein